MSLLNYQGLLRLILSAGHNGELVHSFYVTGYCAGKGALLKYSIDIDGGLACIQ